MVSAPHSLEVALEVVQAAEYTAEPAAVQETIIRSLTIQQAAELTGLTVHTLRYYERINLLTPVGRAANGHRRYDQTDIERINFLNKMRKTGMPLEQIKEFSAVMEKGEAGFPERIALLQAHRVSVLDQIKDLTDMLDVIDYKIGIYTELSK